MAAIYTQAEVNELLNQAAVIQSIGIVGESSQINVPLDGLETPVQLTTFGLSGSQGSVSANGTTGEMTISEDGLYQLNMFVGVTEDGSLKDWELQLYWKINSTFELIDSEYIESQKSNYTKCSVILTRTFSAGDTVSLHIASALKAVVVDVANSTFEVLRKL